MGDLIGERVSHNSIQYMEYFFSFSQQRPFFVTVSYFSCAALSYSFFFSSLTKKICFFPCIPPVRRCLNISACRDEGNERDSPPLFLWTMDGPHLPLPPSSSLNSGLSGPSNSRRFRPRMICMTPRVVDQTNSYLYFP